MMVVSVSASRLSGLQQDTNHKRSGALRQPAIARTAMTFFESLLLLMLVAVALLQLARRLSLPYPALLAAAGVILAQLPHTPTINFDPPTYLALFIAPVLVDAAFDFPPGATRRFLTPLVVFAVFAVLLTTCAVAWIAHDLIGLPWAAGFALGAIVSPPDAAAATAVLRSFSIPRNVNTVLQGESLFNDSTALLLFSTALALVGSHGLDGRVAILLGVAVPGGILFGMLCALVARYTNRFVSGTLGGNLLQFIMAYAVWILASHLKLSAVLATVAFAMTIARKTDATAFAARMRVQSYAVWSAVVFALNVFAFMLMGMQAHSILSRLGAARLRGALGFAAAITGAVILVRLLVVFSLYGVNTLREKTGGPARPATLNQVLFVGWCGMRGFVTMATALALPQNFPQRDVVVLTAFCVVLTTLVLQGLTLAPLVRLLHLDQGEQSSREVASARAALACAALGSLSGETGAEADHLRYKFRLVEKTCTGESSPAALRTVRELGLRSVRSQREKLEELRDQNEISVEAYLALQEQIDWNELTLVDDEDRKIEEI